MEKVRQRLDDETVADFKEQSANFAQGQLNADSYHDFMLSLGLAALVPDIAALLPDAQKRADLLAAHRAQFATAASPPR